MKNRTQKLVLGIVKTLGITVCVLAAISLNAVSALLYYESHAFSNQNELDKQEFSCYRGDLEIRGTVFMPSGQTDAPIAIVCHEFMTNRLFSYPYAIALAKSGYAANHHPIFGQGTDSLRRQGYTCEYLRFPKGCRSLRSYRGECMLSDYPRGASICSVSLLYMDYLRRIM